MVWVTFTLQIQWTIKQTHHNAKTSDGDEVNDVINAHNKHTVTGQVTISDEQDSEIQIMPDLSLPWPNEWQMPEQINLDSSGL